MAVLYQTTPRSADTRPSRRLAQPSPQLPPPALLRVSRLPARLTFCSANSHAGSSGRARRGAIRAGGRAEPRRHAGPKVQVTLAGRSEAVQAAHKAEGERTAFEAKVASEPRPGSIRARILFLGGARLGETFRWSKHTFCPGNTAALCRSLPLHTNARHENSIAVRQSNPAQTITNNP